MSVPLSRELRRRLVSFAAARQLKLATAARTLIDERLSELEDSERLSAAEEWQRAQAWATWEKMKDENEALLNRSEILAVFDTRSSRARRSK